MTVDGVSSTAYVYDGNNRLTEETKNEGQSSETTHYSYDNNGNTICKYSETISPATQGQTTEVYISVAGTDESSNGVNNDNSVTINEYNCLNQLVKVMEGSNTYSYTYNWDGLRASKTVNGVTTNHIWDGDQMVLEADGEGNVTNKYIRGINLIYSGEGANRRYFLYNGHGDTVQLTSTTGSSIKVYDYDAFGNEKNPDPNDTNLFRYCGEYFDKETGTIYLRARYYDPTIGRFICEDPIGSGLNWYTYCGNNPIMFIDPSGLEYIVVSGGTYDTNGGYDYEFIEPAIKKLRELIDLNDGESIAWIVADEGWSKADKKRFQLLVDILNSSTDANVTLKMISYKDELIDYINYKNGNDSRANDKIKEFTLFSHGFPDGTVSLGYNYEKQYNTNLDITKSDTLRIFESAFDNPNSAFYSCNTGTGGSNSFAQDWVDQVGGRTWAFVGKSNYTFINAGENWKSKLSRWNYGFSFHGSVNYPVAGTTPLANGALPYMTTFTR